jgi:hypothetical protein
MVLTGSAARSLAGCRAFEDQVVSVRALLDVGWTSDSIRSQVRAHRWQRIGRAVIRHNGEVTAAELRRVALIVLGPRAVLTAYTALEAWGLTGWQRDRIQVLVPRGARVVRPSELDMRVHYTDNWRTNDMHLQRGLHRAAPAAVLAAGTSPHPRTACGVLAAVVQQRLVRPEDLVREVVRASRVRHRAVLLAAAHDITQGAEALSEIDFARLCRRGGLPEPIRQAVRTDRYGRRRYVDAEWRLPSGRRLVVEVDGALHLAARKWWDDQLRQNELVLTGDTVLRYPTVVVRCEEPLVLDQLRRAIFG